MSTIEKLLRRAEEDGVTTFGIAPANIPGRGIGFITSQDLDKDEEIMHVPIDAIRSLHTVPEYISSRLPPETSLHGLLAAEMAESTDRSEEWFSLVPKWTELEAGIPALWPKELQELLPAEAKRLCVEQQTRLERDWDMFRRGFSSTPRQDFLYAWFLVNTRSFYYETPLMVQLPWNERMALIPVADLFNHAGTGCSVSFSEDGYSFTTDRAYAAGNEIFTSYGKHSNDFLLAEYGFILDENQWDKACLDEVISPRLNDSQKTDMKDNGLTDHFMIGIESSKSDAIWASLRLLSCSNGAQWQSLIDGEEDAEGTLAKATDLLQEVLEEYLSHISETLARLEAVQVDRDIQPKLLGQRWKQLQVLVKQILYANRPVP